MIHTGSRAIEKNRTKYNGFRTTTSEYEVRGAWYAAERCEAERG